MLHRFAFGYALFFLCPLIPSATSVTQMPPSHMFDVPAMEEACERIEWGLDGRAHGPLFDIGLRDFIAFAEFIGELGWIRLNDTVLAGRHSFKKIVGVDVPTAYREKSSIFVPELKRL